MNPFVAPIEIEVIANGMPALLLGLDEDQAIVVLEDGTFAWLAMTAIQTNWRYDWRQHDWIDLKEQDATQDSSLDGGEGVSGSVPESDDLGEGDPFNPEGGQASGNPGDVDTGETQ